MKWICAAAVMLLLAISLSCELINEVIDNNRGDYWQRLGEMPTGYYCFASALVDDKIYFSYYQNYLIYDIKSDTWVQNTNTITARYRASGAAQGGVFYIYGGYSNPNYYDEMDYYNPATGVWTEVNGVVLPARFSSTASSVDGKIYVIGGGLVGTYYDTNQCFTPPGSWVTRKNVPTGVNVHAAGIIGKNIYIFGGMKTGGQMNESLFVYDTEMDSWTTAANLPTVRSELGGTALNGKLYAIGGDYASKTMGVVEEYDPSTGAWTRRADMPSPRCGLQVIAHGGKIYAIGGAGDSHNVGATLVKVVEVYTPPK